MLHAVILLLKALLHFSTLCIHNPPTKRQQASLATQFCSLQMVIYNTIILYAQRDTFLCYLWNDKKWRSLLWNFTWQKWHKNLLLLNEYKQMNLHFLYITPTLLEGSWYRSLLCQHYPMLYTMGMKRNTLHFSSWSNMYFKYLGRSCMKRTVILGRIIPLWGKKKINLKLLIF